MTKNNPSFYEQHDVSVKQRTHILSMFLVSNKIVKKVIKLFHWRMPAVQMVTNSSYFGYIRSLISCKLCSSEKKIKPFHSQILEIIRIIKIIKISVTCTSKYLDITSFCDWPTNV